MKILKLNRYNLHKEFICSGDFLINDKGQEIELIYKDELIELSASGKHLPMQALENLRLELEKEHNSLINCNGCRRDSAYRFTGGFGSYLLEKGKPATERISIFDPTDRIDLLVTVDEHLQDYENWLNSF